jgi:DNA-directed RNA polymerase specialized sigma24 family protein
MAVGPGRRGAITPEAFARFLARLDADSARAAAEYERLRRTLVKFFDWRGAWIPDECADETLDRLVIRIEGGTAVDDVRAYARGIARLVLLERLRQQAVVPVVQEPDFSKLPARLDVDEDDGRDTLRECFDRCLERLPREGRALVLDYYMVDGPRKADNRRRLARALGISDNALRSRVQRLRERLERCARRCATAADQGGLDAALRHVTAAHDTDEGNAPDGD